MWKLTKGNEFLPNVSVKRLQEMYDEEEKRQGKTAIIERSASQKRKKH